MKKTLFLLTLLLSLFILVACQDSDDIDQKPEYEVVFVVYGGSFVPSQTIIEGGLVTKPDDPTKANSAFDNWYEDETLTTIFNFDTKKITANTFIYAQWITDEGPALTHTVTFDTDGGTLINNVTVTHSTLLTEPQSPEKLGYTFIGWYLGEELYDFSEVVTNDLTLVAHWEKEDITVITYTVTFDSFEGSLVEPVNVIKNEKVNKPTDPTKDGFEFTGWYLNNELYDFDSLVTSNITLVAIWGDTSGVTKINSEEDLIALFTSGGDGNYLLTKDLDFTNIEVAGSKATFTGVLDGGGFEINNLHVQSTANKQGAFFKIINGGTIKNFVIKNSSILSGGNGEGTGFITFQANGAATFDNLEFINVSVNSVGAYGALIFADNNADAEPEALKIINKIVVINNSENGVNGKNYTGGLVGYGRVGLNLKISNVYFDSTVKSEIDGTYDQVAGSLIARLNNANSTITVENTVIKGSVSASKNVGPLIGTSVTGATINASKVLVTNYSAYVNEGNKISTTVGNENGMTITLNNYYYNDVELLAQETTITPSKGVSVPVLNETWFNESGLTSLFKLENDLVVLNRESGPKTIIGISIVANSIKTLYYLNEELELDTLEVKLNYSDGSSETILSTLYTINSLEFDKTLSGQYEISVAYLDFDAVIYVTVVEVVSYKVHTIDFKDVYLVGGSFDSSNLYVEATLSNNDTLNVSSNDYELITSTIDFNSVGVYELGIKYLDFSQANIEVIVMNELDVTNNLVSIIVDSDTNNNGEIIEDAAYFKKVGSAINYLTRLNLNNNVKKVIYVKDGIYEEKIMNRVVNLTIVGESMDNTIITFNSPSGGKKPEGGNWGTQGSAIFANKANDFTMANLTVESSFDYFNSNIGDKQAVVIVNEGDRALFTKVKMKSVQDTLYAKSGRQWYVDNYIEGAVDYIFGNGGPAYFEENTIHTLYRSNAIGVISTNKGENNGGIKMDYVYVFYNNTLTTNDTSKEIALGRPWSANASIMFIENNVQSGINLAWTDMSGVKPEDVLFYEYKNIQDDNVLTNTPLSKTMTDIEATNAINKENVFSTTNGSQTFSGVWDYEGQLAFVMSLIN